MRHFLLYHNPEGMGYDFDGNPVDGPDFDEGSFEAHAYTYGPDWKSWKNFGGSSPEEDWRWQHPDTGEVFYISDSAKRIVTSNKKEVGDCIGQQIWVIQGEVGTSPRRY